MLALSKLSANPSILDSSCVELGPSTTAHPDALAPLGQSCEVTLLAVEAFTQRSVTGDSGGGPVLEPHGKVDGLTLTSESSEKGIVLEDGADTFKVTAVERFRCSIVL